MVKLYCHGLQEELPLRKWGEYGYETGGLENPHLSGRAAWIYSAEMEQGSTPLLLSIPAMKALDMVMFLKDDYVELRAWTFAW